MIEINFDKVISDLRYYHEREDINKISSHHKSEAAYQMVSLLLGIQKFFNSSDFDDEYILEKLDTLTRIVRAYVHDRGLNLENW